MSKNPPELLIDMVYRQTFKKPREPELRRLLTDARRCVLSNDMAAFLYTLMVEIYAGGHGGPHWKRRCHRRLDDCRHFSRLPHRVTWVEYSLEAMLQREISESTKPGHIPYIDAERDLSHARFHSSRVGWLMRQHEQIETAVCVYYFVGGIGDDGKPKFLQSQFSIVWCTDDEPLPWKTAFKSRPAEGMSESAYVAGVRGYDRDNVGIIPRPARPGEVPDHEFMRAAMGRGRMMWCFLSTFNKVPIIGEHRVVPTHGFVARGAYHRFLEHKVLTINVPEKAGVRKIARQAIAIIRRRAHQVRGHWRDDWRLQKGNKSLWIAEHQRGDASLGFVTHDYLVEHENK